MLSLFKSLPSFLNPLLIFQLKFFLFINYLHFYLSLQQIYQKDVDLSSNFHVLHKSYGKDWPFENLGIDIPA